MNRKPDIIFSISALCIFVLSLVYFFGSLGLEADRGSKSAEERFRQLGQQIVSAGYGGVFADEGFSARIKALLKAAPDIAAAVITGPEGTEYAYPVPSPFMTLDSQGNPRISATSPMIEVFSIPLNIPETRNVTLTAAFYIMPPSVIYSYGRNTFLIILAVTLIALIVIIGDTLAQKNPRKELDPVNDSDDSESFYSSAVVIKPDTEEREIKEAPSDIDEICGTDKTEEVCIAQDAADEREPESALSDIPEKPEGLFSPVTGFGWESYLETRLDAELSRAASSEEDLALVIARITNMQYTDMASRKIAAVLLSGFKFSDMLFEYGGDGFACILQNGNIDDTMRMAEKLYAEITAVLREESPLSKAAIGLSTRTLRLISAERLIREADQAVNKAFEEETLPIVAFRADPEKYRRYIAEGQ